MSEDGLDIERFLGSILDETYEDMVCLAEKEAVSIERRCYRKAASEPEEQRLRRRYVEQLKEFLSYVRSDVARSVIRGRRERYLTLIGPHGPAHEKGVPAPASMIGAGRAQ